MNQDPGKNFIDVIEPDSINMIDYFEISDKFYLIGGEIKKIYEKLKTGIAIIALQKDPNASDGRGGMFSREKARLYITITPNPPEGNIAKITKCKNWANPNNNPNQQECVFKIRNGAEIIQCTRWESPYKKEA